MLQLPLRGMTPEHDVSGIISDAQSASMLLVGAEVKVLSGDGATVVDFLPREMACVLGKGAVRNLGF